MPRRSAGLLPYRIHQGRLEVLLVHPGGPFWKNKDEGAWSIPKGEIDDSTLDSDLATAEAVALREYEEELGSASPRAGWIPLGEVVQKGGKRVVAWAVQAELDPAQIVSNHFEMVWPPRSGKVQSFPEVDKAEWFSIQAARNKMISGQLIFLDRLNDAVS